MKEGAQSGRLSERFGMSVVDHGVSPDTIDEDAWIDVIQKMDEVYSDLLQYQVALEEKNTILEETQQFVQSMLAAMSDVLVVCDPFGKVVEVNRAMCDLTGLSEADLRGKAVVDLFTDSAAKSKGQDFDAHLHGQSVQDCEIDILDQHGDAVPVAFNCSPRYNQQGRLVGMVMIGRPVGELRKAYHDLQVIHEALKQTQQQLIHSEKMASLGRLVAGVAHELNNPISFVLGNAHTLGRYSQRLREYIEQIHTGGVEQGEEMRKRLRIDRIMDDLPSLVEGTMEGAERSRDIVDGLKRFSAMDEAEVTTFNLTEVIYRSVHWVTKATALANVDVEIDIPDQLLVRLNEGHLQQVTTNLIQNAFDVLIEQGEGFLHINAVTLNGHIELRFHDSGPGIPPEHIAQVFDPFFTTKPVGQGTGLGLSISYGIVERAGGTLNVANHHDGGAIFILTLPLIESS